MKVDNDLYVRDYAKCVLCYKCVEACGEDAQNTFAIAVAGRLKLFTNATSLGGYESLVTAPHPEKVRSATQWKPGGPTIRMPSSLTHRWTTTGGWWRSC